jgi:hypothetical protein
MTGWQGERPRADPAAGWGSAVLPCLLASPGPRRDRLAGALAALPAEAVPALLNTIAYHRIDGLAHLALEAIDQDGADRWLRSTLRRRYQKIAAATLAQGLSLAEILEAFDRCGIPVLVMRGLHSVETIYGDPGARPFEDHDLLVRACERRAAVAALARLGYEAPGPALFRRGGVLVDLHEDPLGAGRRPSRGALFPIDIDALFARARGGMIAGAPALLPSREDTLLLLAIHLVKHSFDRLIRTADLAHFLARETTIAWPLVRERAREWGAARILGWALDAAAALGATAPLDPGPARGRLEGALMRRVLKLAPLPWTGDILVALAAPSRLAALRFLADALLPAGEIRVAGWRRTLEAPRRIAAITREAVQRQNDRRAAR